VKIGPENTQVATRRTRTAGKVEIPNVDDHVSKLEHMGKETVKKLQDIHTAAVQASVEIHINVNCILKGTFYGGKGTAARLVFECSVAHVVSEYCKMIDTGMVCLGSWNGWQRCLV